MADEEYGVPETDIFDNPIDNAKANQDEKNLLPPQGWYTTEVGSTTVRVYKDEERGGRRMASFFATLLNNQNPEVVTKQGFRASPDFVDGKEEGKADWNHGNFLKLRRAFIEATGQEPEKESDVIRYAVEYPLQVRLSHTKDASVMVVAFRAVKE